MLNPALVLAIYYVIFKVIARTQQPHFAIWLFCGLIVWNLFNNSAQASTTVVVGKAGIIKKVAFPRELLAMSTAVEKKTAKVMFEFELVKVALPAALDSVKLDPRHVARPDAEEARVAVHVVLLLAG